MKPAETDPTQPNGKPQHWLFAVLAIVLGAVGQLLLRYVGRNLGAISVGDVGDFDWAQWSELWARFAGDFGVLILACLCYLFAVLTWLRVLQWLPLSRAYPLLALGYVLVYGGAVAWLAEAASWNRSLGTALVAVGVILAVLPVGGVANNRPK